MKKIVALVLSLVMALALCTTAFAAADQDVFYDKMTLGEGDSYTYYAATEYKAGAANKLAFLAKNVAGTPWYYVGGDTKLYAAGGAVADITLGKAIAAEADIIYQYKATECAKQDWSCTTDEHPAGYTYKDVNGKTQYAVAAKADEAADFALLVDGKIVAAKAAKVIPGQHLLYTVGGLKEVGVGVYEAKCAACKQTFKVSQYNINDAGYLYTAATDDAATWNALTQKTAALTNGAEWLTGKWYILDAANGTAANKGTSSPKTFDAGIALYVGMSLMSVAGSAVVIGKKKEF